MYEGKMLVVKHSEEFEFYALPGGHLEWGEDIKTSLEREIIEELGVKPQIGKLLYVNNFIDADGTQSVEFFFEVLNGSEYLNIDHLERTHAEEILDIKWLEVGSSIKILPEPIQEYFNKGEILNHEVVFIK